MRQTLADRFRVEGPGSSIMPKALVQCAPIYPTLWSLRFEAGSRPNIVYGQLLVFLKLSNNEFISSSFCRNVRGLSISILDALLNMVHLSLVPILLVFRFAIFTTIVLSVPLEANSNNDRVGRCVNIPSWNPPLIDIASDCEAAVRRMLSVFER